MRKVAVGVIFLLVGVATSAPALAQSTAPAYPAACPASSVPQAKSDEAHSFYGAGRALYDEGNYNAAIAQFREAYKRDCSKHDLLVIISRSYELNGDRAEAIRALEAFVERSKDSPDLGTHRTKIENLKKQLAAQPPPPPPTPPPEVREHTVLPWLLVGAGIAAVITGTIVVIVAPKLPPSCDDASKVCSLKDPSGAPRPADKLNEGEKGQLAKDQNTAAQSIDLTRGGLITLFLGIGAIGGGLLWHFLEPTGPVAATGAIKPTRITPDVRSGYAGMSLGGTF
jgi:tetratricopeptide (TPR) repeat protein